MKIHGFNSLGSIDVTIDGVRGAVANDSPTRHRQLIAEWETQGNTIPAYVPPPSAAPDHLTVLQEGMLEEFVNRMANNATAPKRLKDAALALKAMK